MGDGGGRGFLEGAWVCWGRWFFLFYGFFFSTKKIWRIENEGFFLGIICCSFGMP